MHVQFCRFDTRCSALHRGMRFAAVLGLLLVVFCGTIRPVLAADAAQTYLGGWDLTIPGGAAGWLGVTEKDGQLQASLLWGGGSVEPVASAKWKMESSYSPARRGAAKARQRPPPQSPPWPKATALDLTINDPRRESEGGVKFTGSRTPPRAAHA